MRIADEALLLYAVTDRRWHPDKPLAAAVEEALQGGVTCLQLREKDLPGQDFLSEAREIQALASRYEVPLIINDNVEVALACGADGVHVGQEDMAAADARRRIGDSRILGVSAQTVAEAVRAEADGADYLGVGAVFPSPSKPEAPIVSCETLRTICKAVSIPVIAIGGITGDNMALLQGSGIVGFALISEIFAAADIAAAAAALRENAKNNVGSH